MNTATEITGELGAVKPDLEAEFLIRKLGVFGSYARGEQRSERDVDILVEFSKPVT